VLVDSPQHLPGKMARSKRVRETGISSTWIDEVRHTKLLYVVQSLKHPGGEDVSFQLANSKGAVNWIRDPLYVEQIHGELHPQQTVRSQAAICRVKVRE
jgi:hypothetical protein